MASGRLEAVVSAFASVSETSLLPASNISHASLSAAICEQLADAAFARGDWAEAWSHYAAAVRSGDVVVDVAKCLLFGARCALYLGEHKVARALLETYTASFPSDTEALFYLGRAFQAAHRDFEALNCFNAATLIAPGRPKYLAAVAQAAHSLAFQGFGYSPESNPSTYLAIARAALVASLAKDPDHLESLTEGAMLALDSGEINQAIEACKQIAAKESKHGRDKVGSAISNIAMALARGGHLTRLLEIDYLASYPAGRRLLARAKALLPVANAQAKAASDAGVRVLVADPHSGRWQVELTGQTKPAWLKHREFVTDLAESVSVDCALVAPVRHAGRAEFNGLVSRLLALPPHFAGIVTFRPGTEAGSADPASAANLMVRKEAWNEIVALNPSANWNEYVEIALRRLKLWVMPIAGDRPAMAMTAKTRPRKMSTRVLVLSRHGPRLVGGGEQFLRIAAKTYIGEQGASVFFGGLTKDQAEVSAGWPNDAKGFADGFIYEDPEALRAFCLANQVDAVHVISGLGEFVLDALSGLNIRIVYGVHFWREFLPARVLSRPFYPNVTLEDARPLPMMDEILRRADFTYVNSDFCADMSRIAYRWYPPVVYSVPIDEQINSGEAAATPISGSRNYVLLANSRADKGWHLFLDIAELLPEQSFLAVASQSDREAALTDVERRGLRNIQVVDRTDDMDGLYLGAKVVVVPSFSFVETFSRVVIEAGRLGRPVLMAESGNLTYLGAGTDLVLPDDPKAWAKRIKDIATKAAAYKKAVTQAEGIVARHSADMLLARLKRIPIEAGRPRILACVGSGIGNITHTSPMITRLSRHFGVPIDILAAGDFSGSAASMAGSEHVGQVFENHAHVAERLYDIVVVTHSFGSLIPSFNAYRVLSSRDFAQFEPGGEAHESEFNLQFIERALGIGYSEADAKAYFFGGLGLEPKTGGKNRVRIGLHAGSKGGIWASKRWPGFSALAGELIRRDVEVVSVGIAPEYVEGTIDKTDLTIARMAEELSTCDAVVSNDSGVMNIANALGVPLVAVFAPTNPVTRGPIKSKVRILAPNTACSPCEARSAYKSRFNDGQCRCISLISIAQVMQSLRELGIGLPNAPLAIRGAG